MFLFILKAAVMIAILAVYFLTEVRVDQKKIFVKINVGLLKEKCQLSSDLFQNYWISGKSEKEEYTNEQYARDNKIDYFGSPADVGFYSGPLITVEREEIARRVLQNDQSFMTEPLDSEPLRTSNIFEINKNDILEINENEQIGGRKIDIESLEDRIIDTGSLEDSIIDTESLEDRMIETGSLEDRTMYTEILETDPPINKQSASNTETESLDIIPYSNQTTRESEEGFEIEDEKTIAPDDSIADMNEDEDPDHPDDNEDEDPDHPDDNEDEELLDDLTRNSINKHERVIYSPGNPFEIEIETTNRLSQKEEFLKMVLQIVGKGAEEVEKINPSPGFFKPQVMKQDGSHSDRKYELSFIVVPSINRSLYFGFQTELKQVNQLTNALVNAPIRPYVRIVTNTPYFRYLRKISSVTYVMN